MDENPYRPPQGLSELNDPQNKSTRRGKRAAIAFLLPALWFTATMWGMSAHTSWEHHPFAGPFIFLKHGEYAFSLFLLAGILIPAMYWVMVGKVWSAAVAVVVSCLTVALSVFAAASASC
jgi:hypothetical protein